MALRPARHGTTLLFSKFELVSKPDRPYQCHEGGGPATWHTWSLDGIKDVPNLRALLQQWDGPRFIDLICNGTPKEYPLNPASLQCDGSYNTPLATLVIGGKPIGQVRRAAVVGFIE